MARVLKHTIVFGYNENSRIFIENLLNCHHLIYPERIMLVTESPVTPEEQIRLEKLGVAIISLPLIGTNESMRRISLKCLGLSKASGISLMYDNAMENYAIFCCLNDYTQSIKLKRASIPCAFLSDSSVATELAIKYQAHSDGLHHLDLKPFCVTAIAAKSLFGLTEKGFGKPLWVNTNDSVEKAWDAENHNVLHLFIAGMNSYGESVLVQALKLGTTSSKYLMHVTILDRNAGRSRERLRSLYPQIDEICLLHIIEDDVYSSSWQKTLQNITPPITYAAICFQDTVKSLWAAQTLFEKHLVSCKTPIGILIDNNPVVHKMLAGKAKKNEASFSGINIVPFGERQFILTRENLFLEALDKRAKQFFAKYISIEKQLSSASLIDLNVDEQWDKLSYTKKESTRAQAEYYDFIRMLCGKVSASFDASAFMQEVVEAGSLNKLGTDEKYIAQLAALEHTRWCRYYYLNGFSYGREKNEDKKTHNFLIADWFSMLDEEQYPKAKDAMKYDLIPILMAVKELNVL